jgi:hypothetical protein
MYVELKDDAVSIPFAFYNGSILIPTYTWVKWFFTFLRDKVILGVSMY